VIMSKRTIILFAVLVSALLGQRPCSAQRTVAGSLFVDVRCSVPVGPRGIGVSASLGKYTIDGYQDLGVRIDNRVMHSPLESEYDVTRICAEAERLWRIIATRNRVLNIYGGAGVALGAEVIDPRGMLGGGEKVEGKTAPFIYACFAALTTEVFITQSFSVTAEARPFLAGGTRYGCYSATADVGFRFTF